MSSSLDEVLSHPASIGARERLAADWRRNGDPRAQFIEDQIVDFMHRYEPGTWMDVEDRIDNAIAEHGKQWAGPIAEVAKDYGFTMGLVDIVCVTGEVFVNRGAELIQMAPIVHLAVDPPIDLAALARVPALGQMRTLSVLAGPWINDDSVTELAASPFVRGLRGLDLQGGQLGERGQQALASSPNLRDIIYIDVTGNPCTDYWPRGMRVERVRDQHYLVGARGGDSLTEATQKAAMGYSPDDVRWPPTKNQFTYEK